MRVLGCMRGACNVTCIIILRYTNCEKLTKETSCMASEWIWHDYTLTCHIRNARLFATPVSIVAVDCTMLCHIPQCTVCLCAKNYLKGAVNELLAEDS